MVDTVLQITKGDTIATSGTANYVIDLSLANTAMEYGRTNATYFFEWNIVSYYTGGSDHRTNRWLSNAKVTSGIVYASSPSAYIVGDPLVVISSYPSVATTVSSNFYRVTFTFFGPTTFRIFSNVYICESA